MKYKFISPYLNFYISNSREKMIYIFDLKNSLEIQVLSVK